MTRIDKRSFFLGFSIGMFVMYLVGIMIIATTGGIQIK